MGQEMGLRKLKKQPFITRSAFMDGAHSQVTTGKSYWNRKGLYPNRHCQGGSLILYSAILNISACCCMKLFVFPGKSSWSISGMIRRRWLHLLGPKTHRTASDVPFVPQQGTSMAASGRRSGTLDEMKKQQKLFCQNFDFRQQQDGTGNFRKRQKCFDRKCTYFCFK